MRKTFVICILAISITLMVNVKVYADEEPSPTPSEAPSPTPEINDYIKLEIVKGDSYSINAMMDYYHNILNDEQKKIARFLLGSYNYMYMTSRGMSYNDVSELEDYITKFNDVADLIFGVDFVDSNTSRWSSNFQIFIASIISYAGKMNVTFEYWLANVAPYVLIPYSDEWLDAWTTFYNDPSNEGVANFGSEQRNWNSGTIYPYLFGDYEFMYNDMANTYSSFLLNNSPIVYTNKGTLPNGTPAQRIYSLKDQPFVDSLYILRGNNIYTSFRFGDVEGNFYNNNVKYIETRYRSQVNKIEVYGPQQDAKFRSSIVQVSGRSLQDIIEYAFNLTPIIDYSTNTNWFSGYYPFIGHVYLVDDLVSLANRQEVFDDYSLDIITGSPWIKRPGTDLPYWWKPIDFEIDIESPEGDLNPSSDDDFNQSIVNNTVINNYDIVAPGVVINVPVNWFDSEGNYLDYSYQYSLPFFAFVGDVFLSLGEIRVFLLAGVILLICGGVIGKFLL